MAGGKARALTSTANKNQSEPLSTRDSYDSTENRNLWNVQVARRESTSQVKHVPRTHKEKMKIKLRNFFFCFSLLFSSSSSGLPKGSLPRKVIAMYFSGISRPKTVGNGSSS